MNRSDLLKTLSVIMEDNPSKDIPYHNNRHMQVVYDIAMEIYECDAETKSNRDRVIIAIAVLLHDYGHSGGELSDAENIDIACKVLKHPLLYNVPTDILEEAEDAIRCTEYPFIKEPDNFIQECLRDADILYACYEGVPHIIMEHLRSEIEVKQGKITYREMLDGQYEFMKNVNIFTDRGNYLWYDLSSKYLDELVDYVRRFEDED